MWVFLAELLSGIVKPFIFGVSYVSSNISFPQPLTPEEEELYLERFEEGDEEARNILVERNLRLVAHIVKKYGNIGSDVDDLISIGTIGLIKGITTFDRSKGTRLATYAARCIENAIPRQRKHYSISVGGICFFSEFAPNITISAFFPSHTIFSTMLLINVLLASTSIISIVSSKDESISFITSRLLF
ncbi:RNA polymerase sporulation-specific sigma factor [Anaerovirgula multivorans]|uniref:RNA polymerase sporulation-specific sigma factor n=1 Tax=Anaerovirgula multivorans TaxID=312168 RepID=A0A238ZPR0_9FIRM|nr:RNA polymerase sporulation-specific sigma factor [Anaerovirgula multivorans]